MTPHVDLETLAALAEGSLVPDDAAIVSAHLATCRSCTAAYADAVRYRAAWLANPGAFHASTRESRGLLRSLGHALDTGAPVPRRAAVPAWLSAAAGLAVVAGAVAAFAWWPRPGVPDLQLSGPVLSATEAASSRGLVLPGGERLAARPAPQMRSGFGEITPEMDRDVNALMEAYERGQRSADDAARLVASLLAVSDLDGARAYAREGLRAYPRDVRILVLHASALQRGNDLAGAEAQLREARRHAGGDPVVALDLALVLLQRGEQVESRALLRQVARSRVAPLAERAKRELAEAR